MQGIGIQHLTRLGVETCRHQHLILFLTCCHCHHHRLSTGGSAIVHRGIGDGHPREFCHHRLIFEDVMQGALGDLCLVRGIGGKELGAL